MRTKLTPEQKKLRQQIRAELRAVRLKFIDADWNLFQDAACKEYGLTTPIVLGIARMRPWGDLGDLLKKELDALKAKELKTAWDEQRIKELEAYHLPT